MTRQFTGYIEGYYGRLLDWRDRDRLIDRVVAAGMNSYFYAPKEDRYHRYYWRQPYDLTWQQAFSKFSRRAAVKGIYVIAGIAPGLDFDFASLDWADDAVGDFAVLVEKGRQLLKGGAKSIALLMDDIAADFDIRAGGFTSEGKAHAALTNRFGAALDAPVIMVPRIYADCLISADDPQSVNYLKDLTIDLEPLHKVVYCGEEIVAVRPGRDKGCYLDPARVMIWDNFYANDYCPRRLFLGPWRVANQPDIMLNLTGMIETDLLLLDLMAAAQDNADRNFGGRGTVASETAWREVISKKSVPEAFFDIAYYFDAPYGFDPHFSIPSPDDALSALEVLLWCWKSPLQREWYACLMGLKQDILLANGQLPRERIEKTQLRPLAIQFGGLAFKD